MARPRKKQSPALTSHVVLRRLGPASRRLERALGTKEFGGLSLLLGAFSMEDSRADLEHVLGAIEDLQRLVLKVGALRSEKALAHALKWLKEEAKKKKASSRDLPALAFALDCYPALRARLERATELLKKDRDSRPGELWELNALARRRGVAVARTREKMERALDESLLQEEVGLTLDELLLVDMDATPAKNAAQILTSRFRLSVNPNTFLAKHVNASSSARSRRSRNITKKPTKR